MHFAGAKNQTFVIVLRNLHTKNHAFSTMCEIFTPLSPTISFIRIKIALFDLFATLIFREIGIKSFLQEISFTAIGMIEPMNLAWRQC